MGTYLGVGACPGLYGMWSHVKLNVATIILLILSEYKSITVLLKMYKISIILQLSLLNISPNFVIIVQT